VFVNEILQIHPEEDDEATKKIYIFGFPLEELIIGFDSSYLYNYVLKMFQHLQAPLVQLKERRLQQKNSTFEDKEIAAVFERLIAYFFTGDTSKFNQLLCRQVHTIIVMEKSLIFKYLFGLSHYSWVPLKCLNHYRLDIMKNIVKFGIPYIDPDFIDLQSLSICDWRPWTENEEGTAILSLASGTKMSKLDRTIANLTIDSMKLANEAIKFGGTHGIYDARNHSVYIT